MLLHVMRWDLFLSHEMFSLFPLLHFSFCPLGKKNQTKTTKNHQTKKQKTETFWNKSSFLGHEMNKSWHFLLSLWVQRSKVIISQAYVWDQSLHQRSCQMHLSLSGVCAEWFMVKGRSGHRHSRGNYIFLSIDRRLQRPGQVISYQAPQSVRI